jgi:hypothetical protein
MKTPSHPRRGPENVVAERAVENVSTTEAVTVTEGEDVTIHLEDEEFGPRSLDDNQKAILRELTRLHRSLSGPQTMLETAGHVSRQLFFSPPPPPPDRQPPPPQGQPQ